MQPAAESHPSERGFFVLSRRQSGVTPREAIVGFRAVVDADLDWADGRKERYRRRAVAVKVASLVLAGLSTVALGVGMKLNRLRDEIDYYLVTTRTGDRDQEQLHQFFADQQRIWRAVSQQWREFRTADAAVPAPRASD